MITAISLHLKNQANSMAQSRITKAGSDFDRQPIGDVAGAAYLAALAECEHPAHRGGGYCVVCGALDLSALVIGE